MRNELSELKIVIMGAKEVGKQAIINQFVYKTFTENYEYDLGNAYVCDFNASDTDNELTLRIIDTSNYHEPMMKVSIIRAHAFILVFNVNDYNTFLELKTLRDWLLRQQDPSREPVLTIVVGNKIDLEKDPRVETENTQDVVTTEWNNIYLEVSAKENLNIDKIFKILVNEVKKRYIQSRPVQRRHRRSYCCIF